MRSTDLAQGSDQHPADKHWQSRQSQWHTKKLFDRQCHPAGESTGKLKPTKWYNRVMGRRVFVLEPCRLIRASQDSL